MVHRMRIDDAIMLEAQQVLGAALLVKMGYISIQIGILRLYDSKEKSFLTTSYIPLLTSAG